MESCQPPVAVRAIYKEKPTLKYKFPYATVRYIKIYFIHFTKYTLPENNILEHLKLAGLYHWKC